MYKKIFLFFTGILFNFSLQAQEVNAPSVEFGASPTTAALAKYADTPVGYYSGTPNINLPIYTINTGGYQLPISLSYHASGIKVAQEASWVGLGWSLNAGGMITREIRGKDDFMNTLTQKGYFYNHENYNDPSNGAVECSVGVSGNLLSGSGNDLITYLPAQCQLIKDSEPDMFFFNIPGTSGKFILQAQEYPAGYFTTGKGILIDQSSNVEIHFDITNGTRFKLTDPNGIIYEFETKEESFSYTWNPNSSGAFTNTSPDKIDTWFLDKIILTNGEEINFKYKIEVHQRASQVSTSEMVETPYELYGIIDETTPCIPNAETIPVITKNISTKVTSRLLEKISWNAIEDENGNSIDQNRIIFNTTNRLDLLDATNSNRSQKLSSIQILRRLNDGINFQQIKKLNLNYGYFNDEHVNSSKTIASKFLRLRLESIQSLSNSDTTTDTPHHSFSYYNEHPLPSKTSNAYDFWGYSNGATENDIAGASRIPEMEVGIVAGAPKLLVVKRVDTSNSLIQGFKNLVSMPLQLTANLLDNVSYETGKLFDSDLVNYDNTLNIGSAGLEINYELASQNNNQAFQEFYENGGLFKTYAGANRNSNIEFAKNGTLKSITYPTGATQEFVFESNNYFLDDEDPVFKSFETKGKQIQNYMNKTNPFVPYSEVEAMGPANYYDFQVFNSVNSYELYYDIDKPTFDLIAGDDLSEPLYIELFKIENGQEVSISKMNHKEFHDANAIWHPGEFAKVSNKTFTQILGPGNYRVRFSNVPQYLNNLPAPGPYLFGGINFTETTLERVTSFDVGGLRIKEITAQDKKRRYTYETSNPRFHKVSSGILISKPNFYVNYKESDNCGTASSVVLSILRRVSDSNYPLTGQLSGKIVGYSEVHEVITDHSNQEKIKTVYTYANEKETQRSWNVPNESKPNNGKLISTIKYNNGKIAEEITNTYLDFNLSRESIAAFNYSSPTPNHYKHQFATHYDVFSEWTPLEKTIIKTYGSGTNNNKYTEKTVVNSYSNTLHKLPNSTIITTLNDESFEPNYVHFEKNVFYYPEDATSLSNISSSEEIALNTLVADHRLHTPIEIQKFDVKFGTSKLISTARINYKIDENLIVPESYETATRQESLETQIEYLSYDDKGNILETKNSLSDVHTYYIWGYNKMYPIAKIDNFTGAQASSINTLISDAVTASNADVDLSTEDLLRVKLELIRQSLPETSLMTSYTYNPLVGITSITDPRGKTMSYYYDGLNRLDYVTDQDGKVLSENEYYYKNQQ